MDTIEILPDNSRKLKKEIELSNKERRLMRISILKLIVICILIISALYIFYKAGYTTGKLSIITNPKLTGEDLIRDFRNMK